MIFDVKGSDRAIAVAVAFLKEETTFVSNVRRKTREDAELELEFGESCQRTCVPYFMTFLHFSGVFIIDDRVKLLLSGESFCSTFKSISDKA